MRIRYKDGFRIQGYNHTLKQIARSVAGQEEWANLRHQKRTFRYKTVAEMI